MIWDEYDLLSDVFDQILVFVAGRPSNVVNPTVFDHLPVRLDGRRGA